MATILSETATYLSTVTVPADGDPRTVASVNVAFSALANRTKYLRERLQALDSDEDGEVDAPLRPPAGTTTVAPLKLTAGTNLTTPENGAVEYDGTDVTITTGGTRKVVATEGQLHDQNTDTHTTSDSFIVDSSVAYPIHKMVSAKILTSSTSWEDLITIPLASYRSVVFSLLVSAYDEFYHHVGGFQIEGVIKRGNAADTTAFVESTPTATRIGSDELTGSFFECQAVADSTNGALIIQGKALTYLSGDTGWGVFGNVIVNKN